MAPKEEDDEDVVQPFLKAPKQNDDVPSDGAEDPDKPSSSKVTKTSYWNLIRDHSHYRWFLVSYIITQLGEWFTYVASLSMLEAAAGHVPNDAAEEMLEFDPSSSLAQPSSSTSSGHIYISMLVVCRLVPNTVFSFLGGILADTCDRKRVMFLLDICGGGVAICFYLMAQTADPHHPHVTTIAILYICTIAQSAISGLYQPSRTAIVPLMVGAQYIEKANELSTIIWSLSAAVGSSAGGFLVQHAGVAYCFLFDMMLYFVSAVLLAYGVRGRSYSVYEPMNTARPEARHGHVSPSKEGRGGDALKGLRRLLQEVRVFVRTHDSAPYLLLKGCGALLFGASDVINVTFSQDPATGILDPQRLGYLFSAIGLGCLLGPLLMPPQRSYLLTSIGTFYSIGIGYLLMVLSRNASFAWLCLWSGMRAAGSAILWVDSSILLQTTTPATLLGRVTAIDYAIALLAEASSALFAGLAQDRGFSAIDISLRLAGLGLIWGVLWTMWAMLRRRHLVRQPEKRCSVVEMEPLQVI
jgi:Major Facilitator Superfamily